jgi:hypothetical protein
MLSLVSIAISINCRIDVEVEVVLRTVGLTNDWWAIQSSTQIQRSTARLRHWTESKAGKSLASARFETGERPFLVACGCIENGLAGLRGATLIFRNSEAAEWHGMEWQELPTVF